MARKALSRNVVVLSWVSFFQDAASEMLYPVIPLFLTGVLGAPVAVVGLIEGIAEGTANAMKAISGRFADFRKRRPLVAAGYGLSSLSKLGIALATTWPLVLVARFVDRTGKGMRGPPRDALIAEDIAPGQRGRAFGFHRAADSAGAVAGPLIGLGLYEALHHRFRPLFIAAFIPAAISVSLIFFVREHTAGERSKEKAERAVLPPTYWRVVAFLALFGLVNFSDALLILRAKNLGLGFASIVLAYAAYNLSYSLLSYPAGALSDRIPRRKVFAIGLGIFAVAYTGLGLARSGAWVWVLLPLYGGYTAFTDGVGRAWIADLLPKSRLGSGLGIFAGIQGATALIAGVWAGLAWRGSGRLPLIVSGIAAGAIALTLALAGARIAKDAPDTISHR